MRLAQMGLGIAGWILVGATLLAGCRWGGDGPTRYQLSGKATHQGRPIPKGRILFAPDTARGNTGPGGVADIADGRYCTRSGSGTVGGPHVATIYGEDGTVATEEHDNALFPPCQMRLDLPKEDSSQDLDVPASARP